MLSKTEIKYIQSLSLKKNRDAERLFVIEGPKIVEELLKYKKRENNTDQNTLKYGIRKIYAVKEWLQINVVNDIDVVEISEDELNRISNLPSPNQVLALVDMPVDIKLPEHFNTITLVLDGIQDPGNLGTIIRIADWFGIENIICSLNTAELYNAKVIQSTMGSFLRVNLIYTDLVSFLNFSKLPVYGAVLGAASIYTVKPPAAFLLLIGSEGKGIHKDLLPLIQHTISIPSFGGAESLNAAVASGIILSHFMNH